jgi:hypothetical protein
VPQEARWADAVPEEVLLLALERHAAMTPWVRDLAPWQHRDALGNLRWAARQAGAALACADPSLLTELLGWLAPRLHACDVPPEVLPDAIRYLADSLAGATPAVAALLVDAVDTFG